MNVVINEAIAMMPKYPVFEAEIRRSGLTDADIAGQLNASPEVFRGMLDGTSRRKFTFNEVEKCRSILRSDYPLSTFFYSPRDPMNDSVSNYVVKALRSYAGGKPEFPEMEGLNKFECGEALGFLTGFLKNVNVSTPEMLARI